MKKLSEVLDEEIARIHEAGLRIGPAWLLPFAAQNRLLPVFLDLGGVLAVAATGDEVRVVRFVWDSPDKIETVTDSRLRNIALYFAAKRFEALRELAPQRSSSDSTCGFCNGTGIPIVANAIRVSSVICYCGGLGWVPRGDRNR